MTISMEDLKPSMCRWPHGDPQDDDFHFCGDKKSGRAYCTKHKNMSLNKNYVSKRDRKKAA